MSPIHSAHLRRPSTLMNTNPIAMSFSGSNQPEQKGFLQKKVIPVIRRIGSVAGKVSDVAGKVAIIASII